MTNIFKIKRYGIVTIGMLLFSFASFAQEIGFDVARATVILKEHGIKDQDLAHEIMMMREMQQRQYLETKKIEDNILQKIQAEQVVKTQKKSSSSNAKTAVVDNNIPSPERQALKTFYNSMGGVNWKNTVANNKPWKIDDDSSDVSTWYGVTVLNGHVAGLSLSSNNLTGTLQGLSALNLYSLSLGNNNLGTIPAWINTMISLQNLDLQGCNLTGPIPDLSALTNLNSLALSTNNFNASTIPSWLYNLKKLQYIWLYSCNLKGEISADIQNLTMLSNLIISWNNLEGSIPEEFNKLRNLYDVWLHFNQLSGMIPNLTNSPLHQFLIQNNKFRFLDFVNESQVYKIKMPNTNNSSFSYSPQAKINIPSTITKGSGQFIDLKMYPDGDTRYLANDTYQWFKNGTAIADATDRVYTIPSLTTADAGTYVCESYHLSNPDMSPLVLEREPITLNVVNGCVIGTIETPIPANTIDGITVSFNTTATGLTYAWRFYYLDGTTNGEVFTNPIATKYFDQPGTYKVTLEVTNTSGCKANFEKMVTVTHNCVTATGNIRIQNSKSDTEVVAGYPANFDFVGNLWINSLEWKFYNPDGTIKNTQNPTANGVSQTFTTPGIYKVMLTIKDYYDCPTTFEKTITVLESCEIPASERLDYGYYPLSIQTINQDRQTTDSNNLINTPIKIIFYGYWDKEDSDFIYSWKIYDPMGTLIETSTVSHPVFTPTVLGNYKIDLNVIDKAGCTTDYSKTSVVTDICEFTENRRSFYITSSDGGGGNTLQVNTNQPFNMGVNFYEEPENENNYSYNWKLFNSNNELINSATTPDFPLTLTIPDFYKCTIEVTEISTGCISSSETYINSLKTDSCTEQNPKSMVVKDLVVNLLKKLIARSLLGETDEQINSSPLPPADFDSLKPYIANLTGNKIYNYTTVWEESNHITSVKFSFSPDREYDVHVLRKRGFYYYPEDETPIEELYSRIESGLYINQSQYVSPSEYFLSCDSDIVEGDGSNEGTILNPYGCREWSEIKNINFCPTDCLPITGILNTSSENPIVNTSTKFSFETTLTNLTYNWKVTNSANVVVDTLSNTTGLYSYIPNTPGSYTVSLKVVNANQCETAFSKTISVAAPLPIVDCETHFNFNFKLPSTDCEDPDLTKRGTILNNIEREHIANGIIKFVNDNKNKKLFLTTYDDNETIPRLFALQNTYTTDILPATTNMSNETLGGFLRFQDQFYNNTFQKIISIAPGIISHTGITKKFDVSFFVISEDNYADIAASKAAYADLLNSTKTNKIFFIFLDEGKFRTPARDSNTYITPIEFASQLKGSAAINYSATGNVMTSDFISYSKAQIADVGFEDVLRGFLNQCYTQAKTKKCMAAGCMVTNPNSQIVKSLFVNLVNKLQSLPAGTVTNGYTCAELIALRPYITVPNSAIFNYNNGSFSFSNVINNYDVFMGANAHVTDINLENYVNSETETNFIAKYGTIEKGCSVKYINFCPSSCSVGEGTIDSPLEEFCSASESVFSFNTTATNLTYKWSAVKESGEVIHTVSDDIIGVFAYNFASPGSYTVKVEATNDLGCKSIFTKTITVIECEAEPQCVNRPVNLSFETISANLNYNWYTVKEGSTEHLGEVTNTTGSYTFNPAETGNYIIHLSASERSECKFEFTKVIRVDTCDPNDSCIKYHPDTTPIIKKIFTTLVNKLISLPAGTVTNGYTCDELIALAYYIKDEKPAIHNFVHNRELGFVSFSFADHTGYDDIKIATVGDHIADFNLDEYYSNEEETVVTTTPSSTVESHINHIDFCSGLYCVSHIAFVVDESGSISPLEATKIKRQLKKYIKQQANDNDRLQSNVYVSLTGMSDSDSITRKDFIPPVRLTNEDPAVLGRFNEWINNYGNRNGLPGISPSSDYWKTGLDKALSFSIKPNIVMVITDGCETNNVEALRDQTMSKFSNSRSTIDTSADKPHLYVVGIANGFYVDGTVSSSAPNQGPNYPETAGTESRVIPVLKASLKYLLSFPGDEFPSEQRDDFHQDFYGYDNFDSLGTTENEAFFSDYLKIAEFACGTPTDKNYCTDCLSFQPDPGKEYMLSAWVKEQSNIQLKTYQEAVINVIYYNNVDITADGSKIGSEECTAKGDIIDGWQRITKKFLIPPTTKTIIVELENKSGGVPVYFDDIRIHPLDGSVKTFVYDSETFKLMSELDENNYSTFYEYDNEGGLVRIKKETAKGVKTIQETRSGNVIKTK